jgi:uncharacterized LabA/DUF88 family protein
MGLQEKDVDWGKVFGHLTQGNRLIRANWYQAARIAPWEWNQKFGAKRCPAGVTLDAFRTAAEGYYDAERKRLEHLQSAIYGRIEESFDSIEFRYGGVLKVDPTLVWLDAGGQQRIGKRVGEKGVDVAIAVDMVRQAQEYDVAVLVSGDFDYVPALQAVKDMLRRVVVVSVMRGSPPQHQGHARRLRSLCDEEVHVYESQLKVDFTL